MNTQVITNWTSDPYPSPPITIQKNPTWPTFLPSSTNQFFRIKTTPGSPNEPRILLLWNFGWLVWTRSQYSYPFSDIEVLNSPSLLFGHHNREHIPIFMPTWLVPNWTSDPNPSPPITIQKNPTWLTFLPSSTNQILRIKTTPGSPNEPRILLLWNFGWLVWTRSQFSYPFSQQRAYSHFHTNMAHMMSTPFGASFHNFSASSLALCSIYCIDRPCKRIRQKKR